MTAPDDLPFTRLGRYDVRARIAQGGMADVFVGSSIEEGRGIVALKVIRPEFARDMQFVAMFLDEGKLTSRLVHPGIVRVFEQANDSGRLFIAMELLFGQSLTKVWEASDVKKSKLPYEVVAWIGARVAEALHHAHELRDEQGVPQEVVHRDVNPSNIFVTYRGQVKIIDFGLAKAVDRLTSTVSGVVKGKLAYMSPEQMSGIGVDRRADIFSLGTTLWEITCGARLFKCDRDVETMLKVKAAEVPDPTKLVPGYPPALSKIVLHALARDRDARYPTAAELAQELDTFAGAGGRVVTPATLLEIMGALFPDERDRDEKWFEQPGKNLRTAPLAPLSLPSDELKTMLPSDAMALPPIAIAPTVLAEPSAPSPARSVSPPRPLSLLTPAELAIFGALAMLALVAIVVAIVSFAR